MLTGGLMGAIFTALGVLGAAGPFLEASVKPVHPGSRMLSSWDLAIEVMDPNATERYNTGVRFTPVAAVIRAVAGGREYLMHTAKPDPQESVAGLFGEFDLETSPPGFEEAGIGEPFVKIGVGALIKSEAIYRFYVHHKIAALARTVVDWKTDSASFVQTLAPVNGYGYKLQVKVAVSGRTLTMDWSLTNTGTKPWVTEHYLHNSFAFDNDGLKPGTVVVFPFDFETKGLDAEQVRVGREIRLAVESPKQVNIVIGYPAGYVGPNALRVWSPTTGLTIDCTTSIPGAWINLHASSLYVCPEQFILIRLQPGQSLAWQRTYIFGILPASPGCVK